MKNLLFLFFLVFATFHANAQLPEDGNDIRWALYKNGPTKNKGGRSGVYLPTAYISDAGLILRSCIDMDIVYSIVTEEENTVNAGILNLRKDEPAVIPVEDLEPGEYQIRITINENVYSGGFLVE